MKSYIVAAGASVMALTGDQLLPGQEVIPGKHIKTGQVDEFLLTGHIKEKDSKKPQTLPGGVSEPKALKSTIDVDKEAPDGGSDKEAEKAAKEGQKEARTQTEKNKKDKKEKGSPKSLWTFDPTVLAKKSLEQLNVLVQETDKTVEAFETKEEAIAWLSQDFSA